jgi:hypothetical protein
VKRWSGFRFLSRAIRAALFATIAFAAAKLHLPRWSFWQMFIALFGVFVLFDEWDSILLTLFPASSVERVESVVLTLGIDPTS